jgi:iron(II)-dependent oxidoreductase
MAGNALTSSHPSAEATEALGELQAARTRTLALVEHLDDEQLQAVHSPLMSPLAWDLGHIAAYEDLWLAHRLGERPLLRPELADLYDAFETPRAIRGEIEALDPPAARAYLDEVNARTIDTLAERGVGDGVIVEMVIRHELQHSETMRQTLAIAGLLPAADAAVFDRPLDAPLDVQGERSEWLDLPAGVFAMGASDEGFAYDNERPRHRVETAAFQIARRPVTNQGWMRFSERGGYERREWWSADGWAWLGEQEQPPQHPAIADGHLQAPVCHVCWFEAEAFARASDSRLPSEAEWERAATWPADATDTQAPAGASVPSSHTSADPVGAGRAGQLEAVGRVWEWTASRFGGYPGFVAYPYREYSEVFFGDHYRVLRGGSWATDARVVDKRFRNWDLPQRRQIFAGLRLARDAA